ncbi:MAG TPA: class I SAM-dependent methyltransferase [Tepidisphaeraceae bacterium]|jgi:SAM-dependent methyltransferase|nr:class I SAM-dependent methyltransferase [Tepidisphaeraceae bacterium]
MSQKPAPTDLSKLSIRGEYERHGAEGYYDEFGAVYRNPHEAIVIECLRFAVAQWPVDLSNVLDLACGSGEATLALRELGAGRIDGVDPYTTDAYFARTAVVAERIAFAEISAGAVRDRRYSLMVCSFALHLCEPSRLPGLMYALGQIGDDLLVITPHKRPEIRKSWGWEKVGESLIERVRVRHYRTVARRSPGT